MTSLWEILKASKGLSHEPFACLAAQSMAGGKVAELSGIPPLSFLSNGEPLVEYQIYGKTVQNGTPTPESPIEVKGVGDRMGNLFDSTMEQGTISGDGNPGVSSARIRTANYIEIEPGEYTLNAVSDSIGGVFVFLYDIDDTFIQRIPDTWASLPYTFTISDKCKMKFVFSASSTTISPTDVSNIMLNAGSTALPYEPYGYKIPISSAGQTVPIYLGQTQTVRRVKKLVLDGTEAWLLAGDNMFYLASISPDYLRGENKILAICTHYQSSPQTASAGSVPEDSISFSYTSYQRLYCCDTTRTNITDFKAYLAAQYAAGTPVTVWYVLATPETAIVNEPLMKIGDYADELHSIDAGVEIPTVKGVNTLTVDTTVQPSSVSIKYKV